MPWAAAGFRAGEMATRWGQAPSCWPLHRLGFPALVSLAEESSPACFLQQQSRRFLPQGNMGLGNTFWSHWGVHQEGKLCRCTSKPADVTPPLRKRSRKLRCLPIPLYLVFKNHLKHRIYSQKRYRKDAACNTRRGFCSSAPCHMAQGFCHMARVTCGRLDGL